MRRLPRATYGKASALRGGSLTPFLSVEGRRFRLGEIAGEGASWTVPIDEEKIQIEIISEVSARPPVLLLRAGEKVLRVSVLRGENQETYSVELNGRPLVAKLEEELRVSSAAELAGGGPVLVSSPMAGKIASVKTFEGATVEEGQALVVLEAMKMENEIAAPKKGLVKEVYVRQGALAKTGDKLVLIE